MKSSTSVEMLGPAAKLPSSDGYVYTARSVRLIRRHLGLMSALLVLGLTATPAFAQNYAAGSRMQSRAVSGVSPVEQLPNLAQKHPIVEAQPNAWEMPAGTAIWGLPPQSPHRVIRQPALLSHRELRDRAHREKFHPPVATIDRAATEPTWRQPYAYGYFGAKPQGHWQRHFGWNRSFTQWSLK